MRTLKKTLCMVLALVMMLGLCAFGTSAAFSDADKVTYKEAVDVLTGIGVIKGMGDAANTFNPNGTLTRAQACTIITKLMGGDGISAKSTFTDMEGAAWAESYVAFCQAKGIVGGYGDGRFGPNDTLTGSQWGRMLLLAAGFDAKTNGFESGNANWEIGVAKTVKDQKMAARISGFNGTQPITRDAACELAFQGMKVSPNGSAGYVVDGVPGGPFELLEAFILSGSDATKMHLAAPSDSLLKTNFPTLQSTTGEDGFGRVTSKWTYGPNATTIYEQAAAASKSFTVAKAVASMSTNQDIVDALNAALNLKTAATMLKVPDAGSITFSVNGDNTAAKALALGQLVEVYADQSNKVTAVVVASYEMASIKAINAKTGNITLTVGGVDKTIAAPTAGAEASANYTALKDFALQDVLAVCMKGENIVAAVKAQAVAGKVTARGAADVTMSGTKYAVANGVDVPTLGSEGTLYLAPNGVVIGFVGKQAQDTSTYAFVVASYDVAEGTAYGTAVKHYVQAIDMNGQEVSYPTFAKETVSTPKLMKVSADTADGHTGMYTFASTDVTDSTAEIKATDKRIGTTYFTSDVQFIYVSGSLSTLKITVKSGVQAVTSTSSHKYYVAKAVPGTSNTTTSVVFIADAYETPVVTTSDVAFVKGDAKSTNSALLQDKDGKDVTGYAKTVYIDGEKTTIYYATDAAVTDGFYAVSKNGDLTVLTDIATAANLVEDATFKGYFNNLLSYNSAEDVTVASDVVVINLVENSDAGLTELVAAKATISLVLSADAKTITTVYITAITQ